MQGATHARDNVRCRLSALEEQRELVAAEAVQLFRRTQRTLGHACERAQNVVADGVAETVVGVFEVVEVEQRKTEGGPSPEQHVEPFVERATVLQAGERVTARLRAGEQEQTLAGDRGGGQIGDGGDELHVEHARELHRHCNEERTKREPVRHERERKGVPEQGALDDELGDRARVGADGRALLERPNGCEWHTDKLMDIERPGRACETESGVAREVHGGHGSARKVVQLSRDDRPTPPAGARVSACASRSSGSLAPAMARSSSQSGAPLTQ